MGEKDVARFSAIVAAALEEHTGKIRYPYRDVGCYSNPRRAQKR